MSKYTVRDTFTPRTLSKHRTLQTAVAAQRKFQRSVKRANGQTSYIPTEILCDGKRLTQQQADEANDIRNALDSRYA